MVPSTATASSQRGSVSSLTPPQLIVDAFSNGKSTTGQTELIVQNYTDSLIRDRSLVVIGSA